MNIVKTIFNLFDAEGKADFDFVQMINDYLIKCHAEGLNMVFNGQTPDTRTIKNADTNEFINIDAYKQIIILGGM